MKYARVDSNQDDSSIESKGFAEKPSGSAPECAPFGDDDAKLAYLKAGWPDAPEDALRTALGILNGERASIR